MSDDPNTNAIISGVLKSRSATRNSKAQSELSATAGSADWWNALDWPNPKARFEIYDDGDPHGILAIVLPGGQLMVCSGHADMQTDMRRAIWIRDALNEKRDRENPPNA
jgi:hypothetical protein